MQVTKQKLKKIIKEEIQTILNEGAVRIPGVNVPEDYVPEPESDPYAHMRDPATGRLYTDEEAFGLPPKPESAPFADVAFEEEHVPPEHKKYLDELELYGKETDYGPEWGKEHGEYWDRYYASEGGWEWDEETNSWDMGFKPGPDARRAEEERSRIQSRLWQRPRHIQKEQLEDMVGELDRETLEDLADILDITDIVDFDAARKRKEAAAASNMGVDPTPIDPKTGLDFKLKMGMRCTNGQPVPESRRCPEGGTIEIFSIIPAHVKKFEFNNKWHFHNQKTGRIYKAPKGY